MLQLAKRGLEYYKYLIWELRDPRYDVYPFMDSPIKIAFILVCYVLFVFQIGPRYMKNRKPYDLKKIIIAYNAAQMFINCYELWLGAYTVIFKFNWICQPIDYSDSEEMKPIVTVVYIYFALKLIDLLDTVFFVLRKKYNQVTFLHVYHHVLMVIMTWISAKYFGGGHTTFLGLYNTIVHVFMYGYYLIAAVNDNAKNNIWWKKYITRLQLFQFFLIYCSYIPTFSPSCNYSKFMSTTIFINNTLMVYLFGKFYYNAYIKKKA